MLQLGEGSFSGEYPDPPDDAALAPRDASSAQGARWADEAAAARGVRRRGSAREEERRSAERPRRVADAAAMLTDFDGGVSRRWEAAAAGARKGMRNGRF